jgi:putative ABC transport system permease protein
MSFLEMLRSAFRGVTANKLRSALTLLGVMIGVAAVILLLAVGNGSAQRISELIDELGTKTITVRAMGSFGFSGGGAAESTSQKQLTLDVSNRLESAGLGHVAAVVPQVSTDATVSTAAASEDSVSLLGTSPDYFEVTAAAIATGEAFSDADVESAAKVAVIGSTLAATLFPGESALGRQISVGGTPFTVVGVLETQSSTGFSDANSVVVAPISRVQNSYTGFGPISTITVEATSSDDVVAAEQEVEIMLDQLLGVGEEGTAPYTITNESSLLETEAASAQALTVMLGVIGAIALLVGGIGVTNVMLVTVTERTREIGIRKALGATRPAILGQFLVEAATLTLLGGVLGVVIAIAGAGFPINGIQPVVLEYSIPLALGVSVAIGVFFGVYPAARAANMRPIQALRSV